MGVGGNTVQIRLRFFWTTLSLSSIPVFWCLFFCGDVLRNVDNWTIVTEVLWVAVVESSWNVMAHGDAREGKWRVNWRMEWVTSPLHTTSEHGVSSITTADAHTSAASSRLNWRPLADLNGLVRFAERRNLVSARVPPHFSWPLPMYCTVNGHDTHQWPIPISCANLTYRDGAVQYCVEPTENVRGSRFSPRWRLVLALLGCFAAHVHIYFPTFRDASHKLSRVNELGLWFSGTWRRAVE